MLKSRTFKVKAFSRWARKERISDAALRKAALEMRNGLIDADLGSGLCKKRIAVSSRGKRGGGRTIVAFRASGHMFFMFGFMKNEREDIDPKEVKALKQFASYLLKLSDGQIVKLISQEELFEVE